MPVVKTYEYNAYDQAQFNVNQGSSEQRLSFVKAIKFYDYRKDGSLLTQFKIDEGVMDDAYRTYDVSTLYYGNCVIFYKRFEKWFQL
jgi:hypothetical protein